MLNGIARVVLVSATVFGELKGHDGVLCPIYMLEREGRCLLPLVRGRMGKHRERVASLQR